MFSSNPRIIFAVVGCLTLAASPPGNSVGTEQVQAKGGITESHSRTARELQDHNEPDTPDAGCPQGKDDRTSVLCAEWKAADAAAESALWAKWAFFFGILTLAIAGAAAIFAWRGARETERSASAAQRALKIDQTPSLFLSPKNAEDLRWDAAEGKICKGGQSDPVLCAITSGGRSPAVLLAIARDWAVCEIKTYPPPLDFRSLSDSPVFVTDIPIHSEIIVAGLSGRAKPALEGTVIYFYGYLVFCNINRSEYFVCGFMYEINPSTPSRGLITAMPDEDAEKYWYHRPLTEEEVKGQTWRHVSKSQAKQATQPV